MRQKQEKARSDETPDSTLQKPRSYSVRLTKAGAAVIIASSIISSIVTSINKRGDAKKARKSRIVHKGPVTLQWKDVTVTLRSQKHKAKRRVVVNKCSGEAARGRISAILGPSGAGKSTLLTSLAHQLPEKGNLILEEGTLLANGENADPDEYTVAYVRQDDLFFGQLSVRETLETAARLRFGASATEEEIAEAAEKAINEMSLNQCAETAVGNDGSQGISGGERKRLAIACELVNSPSVVFLDEPTSGLDAFQAEKVMKSLRRVKEQGKTVLCTLHQPGGGVWRQIDDVYILADGGRLVYGGLADELDGFLRSNGLECKHGSSVQEFALECATASMGDPEGKEGERRIEMLANAAERRLGEMFRLKHDRQIEVAEMEKGKETATEERGSQLNVFQEFGILLQRSKRQVLRDTQSNKARLLSTLSSAVTFALVYQRLGRSQAAVQSRLGLLQVSAVSTAMTSMIKTLNVFSKEKLVVQRERKRSLYRVGPYFVSKLIAESPASFIFPFVFTCVVYPLCNLNPRPKRFGTFLSVLSFESSAASSLGLAVSALTPSFEAASATGPALMTVFIVFGGAFVDTRTIPFFLRFLPKVSLIGRAFEGFASNEFRCMSLSAPDSGDAQTGDEVLRRRGLVDRNANTSRRSLAGIAGANMLITYAALRASDGRMQSFPGAS